MATVRDLVPAGRVCRQPDLHGHRRPDLPALADRAAGPQRDPADHVPDRRGAGLLGGHGELGRPVVPADRRCGISEPAPVGRPRPGRHERVGVLPAVPDDGRRPDAGDRRQLLRRGRHHRHRHRRRRDAAALPPGRPSGRALGGHRRGRRRLHVHQRADPPGDLHRVARPAPRHRQPHADPGATLLVDGGRAGPPRPHPQRRHRHGARADGARLRALAQGARRLRAARQGHARRR